MDPELLDASENLPATEHRLEKSEIPRTEQEWKGVLTPQQFHVLREKGTERPFGQDYEEFKHQGEGEYVCSGCGNPLFKSDAKFDSGCGWPSFYQALDKDQVNEHEDTAYGMRRVEVTCARCGGHLGHIFPDGHGTPTGMRYCINAVSIEFIPQD